MTTHICELNYDIQVKSGYGQTGPFRQAAGYDVVIEAEAGLMHMYAPQNHTFPLTPTDAHSLALANLVDRLRKSAWRLRILLQDCTRMVPSWQRFFLGKKPARESGSTAIYLNLK